MQYVCVDCISNAVNLGKKINNEHGDNYCYSCGDSYASKLWIVLEHARPASLRTKRKKRPSYTNLDPANLRSMDFNN